MSDPFPTAEESNACARACAEHWGLGFYIDAYGYLIEYAGRREARLATEIEKEMWGLLMGAAALTHGATESNRRILDRWERFDGVVCALQTAICDGASSDRLAALSKSIDETRAAIGGQP